MASALPIATAVFVTEDQGLTFFSLTLPHKDIRDKIAEAIGAAFRIDHPVIAPANIILLGDANVFVQLVSPLAEYRAAKRLVGELARQYQLALSTTTYSIDEIEFLGEARSV